MKFRKPTAEEIFVVVWILLILFNIGCMIAFEKGEAPEIYKGCGPHTVMFVVLGTLGPIGTFADFMATAMTYNDWMWGHGWTLDCRKEEPHVEMFPSG